MNFHGADLRGADFHGADLRCIGDMKYIKTLQLHMWMVGYTYDALQIGCEYHPIEKWREWNTPEKRERIDLMDKEALGVALQYLDLLLSIVDACPAERP